MRGMLPLLWALSAAAGAGEAAPGVGAAGVPSEPSAGTAQRVSADELELLRDMASKGSGEAMCRLGMCYLQGQGVVRDVQEALRWFRRSAEAEDALGRYNLALCYAQGIGVRRSWKEAVRYFRLAAEQQLPEAQYNLARCYENGLGVKRSAKLARKWYARAAAQGHEAAARRLRRAEGAF